MANQGQGHGGNKSGSGDRRSERGFAAMDPALQREIAAEGGRAAHEKGTAHEFTSEEAREAGRKGGEATAQSRGARGAQAQSASREISEENEGQGAPGAISAPRSGKHQN